MRGLRVERLDQLGMVARVCQEIGLAAYLDALAEPSQQQVSVGTTTVADDPERARAGREAPVPPPEPVFGGPCTGSGQRS